MCSMNRNSFLRPLKNKGFQEVAVTKIGLYDIVKSTTLESNKSHEASVSALKMQFQLVGPDDLIGHTEFGQVEQGVDILKIHTSGSSCWVPGFFQHFARNPAWVNIYSKLLIINTMC